LTVITALAGSKSSLWLGEEELKPGRLVIGGTCDNDPVFLALSRPR
jgi:hypothetical protein